MFFGATSALSLPFVERVDCRRRIHCSEKREQSDVPADRSLRLGSGYVPAPSRGIMVMSPLRSKTAYLI